LIITQKLTRTPGREEESIMNTQVALAVGIVNGRIHSEQDHALLRSVELAQQGERRARRALRAEARRGR